jgi:hypothetical protein
VDDDRRERLLERLKQPAYTGQPTVPLPIAYVAPAADTQQRQPPQHATLNTIPRSADSSPHPLSEAPVTDAACTVVAQLSPVVTKPDVRSGLTEQRTRADGEPLASSTTLPTHTDDTGPLQLQSQAERAAGRPPGLPTVNNNVHEPTMKSVTSVRKKSGNLFCRIVYHDTQEKVQWIAFDKVPTKLITKYYLDEFQKQKLKQSKN